MVAKLPTQVARVAVDALFKAATEELEAALVGGNERRIGNPIPADQWQRFAAVVLPTRIGSTIAIHAPV